MERRKKWTVIVLLSAVISIGLFVGFSIQNIWRKDVSPMRFTFIWGPEEQDIVNGTLRMDVLAWFENYAWDDKTTEMFNIQVKVNVTDYSRYYALVLVFDVPSREEFFYAGNHLTLYSGNFTAVDFVKDGVLHQARCKPRKVYACNYNPSEGYTFGPYSFVAAELMVKPENSTAYIPMTIYFYKGYYRSVSCQLRIETDKTEIPEIPAYEIQITSVNASKVTKYPDTPYEETYHLVAVYGRISPPVICKSVSFLVKNSEGKIFVGGSNVTNPDGSFKLTGWCDGLLPPGTYNVQARLGNVTSNILQFTIRE